MIEKPILSVFFFCLFYTATGVLCLIWLPGAEGFGFYEKTIPTTFIIGIAAFITWAVLLMQKLATLWIGYIEAK